MDVILYTDGASRGNPGPSSIAYILQDDKGNIIKQDGEYVGELPSNEVEYLALEAGIKAALDVDGVSAVEARSDSELMIRQMLGIYRTRTPELLAIQRRIRHLVLDCNITYEHIPRKLNYAADRLANQVLNLYEGGA